MNNVEFISRIKRIKDKLNSLNYEVSLKLNSKIYELLQSALLCDDNISFEITQRLESLEKEVELYLSNINYYSLQETSINEVLNSKEDDFEIIRKVLYYYDQSENKEEYYNFFNDDNKKYDTIVITGKKIKEKPDLYKNIKFHKIYYLEISDYFNHKRKDDTIINDDSILGIIIDAYRVGKYTLGECLNLETVIFGPNVRRLEKPSWYSNEKISDYFCYEPVSTIYFFNGIEYIAPYTIGGKVENLIIPPSVKDANFNSHDLKILGCLILTRKDQITADEEFFDKTSIIYKLDDEEKETRKPKKKILRWKIKG